MSSNCLTFQLPKAEYLKGYSEGWKQVEQKNLKGRAEEQDPQVKENNFTENEGMEPNQKQHPVVDVTGDRSKVPML